MSTTIDAAPDPSVGALPAALALADHSRFVQRIRRRYAAELALLTPGLPTRARIDALIDCGPSVWPSSS